MELTRRELKEDFKPYKVRMDRKIIDADDNILPLLAKKEAAIAFYDGEDYYPITDKEAISELISRDCEQSIIGKQDWTPYDIDEAKPYCDASVFQINRLMDSIKSNPFIVGQKFFEWQLSEAKLELINRN